MMVGILSKSDFLALKSTNAELARLRVENFMTTPVLAESDNYEEELEQIPLRTYMKDGWVSLAVAT